MAVTVILETTAKPGGGDELLAFFDSILADTRAYAGCISIDTLRNMETPDEIVVYERWETADDHGKYMGWRTETGVVDQIVALLAGPPVVRRYEETGV
ncbi:MAG: putative quinol monooxygenase [Alphaproteobacteria bacterium]|jgi:quinol monooxygenase YgiN|nr:putative quinol monooxygenase [Alphaproteobacteria bacterium]